MSLIPDSPPAAKRLKVVYVTLADLEQYAAAYCSGMKKGPLIVPDKSRLSPAIKADGLVPESATCVSCSSASIGGGPVYCLRFECDLFPEVTDGAIIPSVRWIPPRLPLR